MNFSMELRSRRSKSKTPMVQTVIEKKQSENIENHVSESKSILKTFSTKTTYSSVYPSENITSDEISIDHNKNGWHDDKLQYTSSFHTDDEVTSTNMTSQNTTNESFENIRNSFNSTDSNVSALDFYRAAGDYWNKYPKTDYTYSLRSKDRKEIAPGIIAMPNMSRRSLHSYSAEFGDYSKSSNIGTTGSFFQDEVDYSTKTNRYLSSATKAQPNTLYLNNNKESSYSYTSVSNISIIKRITTSFTNMLVTILTFFYVIYTIQNSVFMWIGKKIHKTATRLMLWDTWLLQSNVTGKKKLNSILALCFIPLLLFGGWWLFYGLGPAIFGTDYDAVKTVSNAKIHEYVVPSSENAMEKVTDNVAATFLSSDQLEEITKLLENPSIQDILNNNKHLKFVDDSYREDAQLQNEYVINDLKQDILKVKMDLKNLEKDKHSEFDILVAQLQNENAEKIAQLTYQLNRCCRSSYLQIENHVIRILRDLMGAPNYLVAPQDISKWLHSTFVAKHDLERRLNNLTQHLHSDYNTLIDDNGKLIMRTVMDKVLSELNSRIDKIRGQDNIGEINVDSLTDAYVKKIVQNALAIYDADKTGLVDYALESAGGQILSTRCTESYHARTAVFSLFNIPLWYLGNTPRTVIMPGVTPGECWAFQNFPGFVVIKLAASIKVEAFSLEHISKMLAPNGKIDSAPKEFSVYGLRNESDKEPVILGQYKYDLNGPPLQYFPAHVFGLVFDIVELRIHSNHGNPNYTCLYRFRVHGILSNEPT